MDFAQVFPVFSGRLLLIHSASKNDYILKIINKIASSSDSKSLHIDIIIGNSPTLRFSQMKYFGHIWHSKWRNEDVKQSPTSQVPPVLSN